MNWTTATTTARLAQEGRVLFKSGTTQLVVLDHDGELFAFDNRCPHQGFPLQVGTVDGAGGCTLTCNWHNWKFDLATGACTTGGDRVRVYPTRVVGDEVQVDLAEPAPDVIREAILADLRQAFDLRDYGRISRELTRLALRGLDPADGVKAALIWGHDRWEWGTRHGVAAAADWVRMADAAGENAPDPSDAAAVLEERLIALTEAVDHLADDSLRHPVFPYPTETLPDDPAALAAAIEAEDEPAAIARLRGALAAGLAPDAILDRLATAALAHYNSGGHSIIYVEKTRELIARLGPEVAEPLLLALTRHLIVATREDLVPEFKAYAPALAAFPAGFGADETPPDPAGLRGRGVAAALEFTADAARRHTPLAIWRALTAANAANLRDFDTRFQLDPDLPPKRQAGWLHLTHALTMGNAVRVTAARDPARWPAGLLQLAMYVGRNQPFLLAEPRTDLAVEDPAAFAREVHAHLTDHGLGMPIYSAHLVKTWTAVRDDLGFLGEDERAVALASMKRFLWAPLRQKHARRAAKDSLRLVGRDFPIAV